MAYTVQAIRQQAQMSQEALAKAAGVSRQTISALENNKANATVATLSKLANALRCQVSDIFCP